MKKILIVEDEALASMMLKILLLDNGFTVCGVVTSGEKAVEFVKTDEPDFILMDIQLSGEISGIEAVAQIHAIRKIPVVFVTGYSDQQTLEQARQVDYKAYLYKPVEIEKLIAVLKS